MSTVCCSPLTRSVTSLTGYSSRVGCGGSAERMKGRPRAGERTERSGAPAALAGAPPDLRPRSALDRGPDPHRHPETPEDEVGIRALDVQLDRAVRSVDDAAL